MVWSSRAAVVALAFLSLNTRMPVSPTLDLSSAEMTVKIRRMLALRSVMMIVLLPALAATLALIEMSGARSWRSRTASMLLIGIATVRRSSFSFRSFGSSVKMTGVFSVLAWSSGTILSVRSCWMAAYPVPTPRRTVFSRLIASAVVTSVLLSSVTRASDGTGDALRMMNPAASEKWSRMASIGTSLKFSRKAAVAGRVPPLRVAGPVVLAEPVAPAGAKPLGPGAAGPVVGPPAGSVVGAAWPSRSDPPATASPVNPVVTAKRLELRMSACPS
jgi:hypothetical protein